MISSPDVSEIIRAILKEAGIKTKEAVFSIPDFSTFFTTFQLPPMSEEELPGAVHTKIRWYQGDRQGWQQAESRAGC